MIARADGSVLYNFAVAIDDLDAGITHVVRGEDHLSNTPKQLLVLAACKAAGFGPEAPEPVYAHLPLLHGADGKKLSKRHGAASVQRLRAAGYLPSAVRNYLALLGWGSGDDATVLSTSELVERFELSRVSRNPARFDEAKLRWLDGIYIRALAPAELAERLLEFLRESDPTPPSRPKPIPRCLRVRRRSPRRRSRRSPTSGRSPASSSSAPPPAVRPTSDGLARQESRCWGRRARRAVGRRQLRRGRLGAGFGGRDRASLAQAARGLTSPCAWRSPAPRSHPASSRAWRYSVARRPCVASTSRSPAELPRSTIVAKLPIGALTSNGTARMPPTSKRCHAHASNSDKAPNQADAFSHMFCRQCASERCSTGGIPRCSATTM